MAYSKTIKEVSQWATPYESLFLQPLSKQES
jgi:hypothetical protein